MTRVLWISHEASRTGAPRALLYVMEAARDQVTTAGVSLKGEGPLEEEFARYSRRILVRPGRKVRWALSKLRLLRLPWIPQFADQLFAAWAIIRTRPEIVYINSVIAADYVRPAVWLGKKTILHCHELNPTLAEVIRGYRLQRLAGRFELVGCSSLVQSQLRELMGTETTIHLIHEPVDVERVIASANGSVAPKIPLVTACGTVDPRKGPDLWLEAIASALDQMDGLEAKFRWIGTGPLLEEMRSRVRLMGLEDRVEFVGELANPYPYIAASSVVCVPSRLDPFPLVTLEAMALEKPVLAFDVGGLKEQVEDTGIIVEPFDVRQMGKHLASLLQSEELRDKLGSEARQRVARLYDIERFKTQARTVLTDGLQ